nr:ribonuclease H-like domain-containing protein [Tanacetum cinerariifolium]
MESLSPQVVSAAKLPILNPNEFDLWKMRIEKYFLMTNYSLWEVILNGNSPVPTRVIDGVLQPVAPTTVKQRLQKLINQLEILRVSLSQEYINLKFLRCLSSEWRTHTLIWRNKTDLEEQSLNDLFNGLKIYDAEVKSSSSASNSIQNIAFVSSSNTDSTTEPVSAAASMMRLLFHLRQPFQSPQVMANAGIEKHALRAKVPVSTSVSKLEVARPRQPNPIITKANSPSKRHINRSPSLKASNSPPRVTAVNAPMGNPQHALKDKGVIDSGYSRHIAGNMSYLSDFEELNGGYVTYGGNPKG